ncbi:AAA family ATPase [Cyanobacteria bacterium FACHB-472]|nr:AAA family ATPase [Cyanobacteria bacterium FACHB-472]
MIVAIANQKGGVGKTTSVISLGGLLVKQGASLAVDLDPQGNLTTGLGVEVADDQLSCYDVITEQVDVCDAVVPTKSGLSLLPSDITLAKGETEILTKVGNFYILKERLERLLGNFPTS